MIVADTSVWIGARRGTATLPVRRFVALVESNTPMALTDIVLAELLAGARSEREARALERDLAGFPVLRLQGLEDFRSAAGLYRRARAAGYTIRKLVDCLIAAVCIRTGSTLLHADADFDRLALCTDLRVLPL